MCEAILTLQEPTKKMSKNEIVALTLKERKNCQKSHLLCAGLSWDFDPRKVDANLLEVNFEAYSLAQICSHYKAKSIYRWVCNEESKFAVSYSKDQEFLGLFV